MKAALISLGSISSQMTAEAMKKYFEQVDMIQLRNIEVSLGREGKILYEGKEFPEYDCVYLKGSFRYANLLRSITTLLKEKVAYMPIPPEAYTIVHNKLLTHLALEKQNIPMPKTFLSSTVGRAKELLDKVNYPIVMKFPEGTQGKGVMFADSKSSASSMLDALGALNQPFIIQEYIETDGIDIRAFVIGDKVVAAMKRVAKPDEKRANTHSGGTPQPVQLSRAMSDVAVKTAKALGADICGIDLLENYRGPLVIEANISPGLQGISSVSTVDIANEIGKFLHKKTEEIVSARTITKAKAVMKEAEITPSDANGMQQIVTTLSFRGDRVLLPEIATTIAKLNGQKEYTLRVAKGRVEIQEFK